MTHDEFMAKVKSAKSRLKGIDYYYFFAELSIDYISELESEANKRDAEIEELKKNQVVWHELPASGVDETLDRPRQYVTRLDVKTQKWSWAYAFDVEEK